MRNLQPTLPFGPMPSLAPPLRRRVHRVRLDPSPDGTYTFRARSFSRRRGVVYRCKVNPVTGRVWCSCRDFQYRKRWLGPTYFAGDVCKHLRRAIRTIRQVERARAEAAMPLAA